MNFSYYPGCSLHGASREYDISTRLLCNALDVELKELPDWICCGASSGHSVDAVMNIGLSAYNLKIAESQGLELAVPCAACFNRFKVAEHAMKGDQHIRQQMANILDYHYQGTVKVLNLVELIRDRVGLDTVRSKVVKPLTGLRVASYYGCLLVRPPEVTGFDDPENPSSLDEIVRTIGAESVTWSYKTECCGGSHSLTRSDIVSHLVDAIVDMAREAGAHIITTACPLCFENLEMRQSKKQKFPIFYFTELVGLALGLKESIQGMNKHMVDPKPLFKSLGLLS